MAIQYDGRSLVPDLGPAISMLLGVARDKAVENKETARREEAAGLTEQLTTTQAKDPLQDPETLKVLARLNSVDPSAARFGIALLQTRDERQLQAAKKEAADASLFYQAVLDTKDPVERTRFIANTIREREEQGLDTTKLRELMGLDQTKQSLFARRQIILAGDASTLADQGMQALKDALDIQAKQLDILQKQQDITAGKETDVAGLRKEFTTQSKDFIGVRDAYGRVKAAAKKDSAAGDMALVFGIMKMLDPTSVVREGEQASAQNAAGVPDRVRNLYNRALTGERLTPSQRADFVTTAGSLFDKQLTAHQRLRAEYGRIAERRGFDPADVLVDFRVDDEAPAAPQPPAVPAAGLEGRVMRDKATGARWLAKGGQWQLLQ